MENQTLTSEQIGPITDGPKSDSEETGHTSSDTFKQSDAYIGQTKSDSDSDSHIEQKANQTPGNNRTTRQSDKKTDTSKKEKKSDKVVQFKKKKSDKQTRGLSDEEIKKMAEEFKSENGKLPSIRKLAEIASCSKYKAEKAINELREAQ
ncbi:hypothetical protein H1164_15705 [Thermoactinomyces daqus]|uniref:Uncharacterized protein n=1 Tax=Thermoactinomyces daqus TaxID=1329516 RepID=A0A7W1XD13_9BACL|nr:hypothetical protein [Thermoactinomyces daqus]MBA4544297.1 hypothetical protein [Thermoactinomyces daqus]